MPALPDAIGPRLGELGIKRVPALVVALSGGLDSVVLLHLLRFGTDHPLVAAHLDHRMRAASTADARWVRGLCAAWGVPLALEAADPPPRGEAEARRVRYAFLRGVAEQRGAQVILTAHHADDQAETVLFRAARGSGIRGLRGILERDGALARPLLPWTRLELARHARASQLRWREDATNAGGQARRNRLRHQVLPLLEAEVAPGARRNLARLAAMAAEREEALGVLLRPWMARVVIERGREMVLRRAPFGELPPPAAAELLRAVLVECGWGLGAAGTRAAVTFITDAPSGRALRPGGGIEILSEYERVRVRELVTEADRPLRMEDASGGAGEACLGGHLLHVAWTGEGEGERVAVPLEGFPALIRAWRPGDALRRGGRRRSLREQFRRNRVPRAERARTPVLEDASGEVRWCRGIGAADAPSGTHRILYLNVRDD
jgi:tRNA(Ile)-lysidine synthase